MIRKDVFAKAEEMGMDNTEALKQVLRGVREQIHNLKTEKEAAKLLTGNNDVEKAIIANHLILTQKQIKKLQFKHSRLLTPKSKIQGITDDDIETARAYPIETLVDLKGNRCIAFCHDSDTHSMKYNNSSNTLTCFVCNKTFNPIDVLMERDGFAFIEAVEELS